MDNGITLRRLAKPVKRGWSHARNIDTTRALRLANKPPDAALLIAALAV